MVAFVPEFGALGMEASTTDTNYIPSSNKEFKYQMSSPAGGLFDCVLSMTLKGLEPEASSRRTVKNLYSLVPIQNSCGWPVKNLNRQPEK